MSAALDKDGLLAWLLERAKSRSALIGAIYGGLADRIRRGDFDHDGGR